MVIQRLNNHTSKENCLYFMKQTNSFVSGSNDHSMIIWELDKNDKWVANTQLKLEGNQESVLCICMNKKEDMLISGGQYTSVNFWRNINNQWICQQTIYASYKTDSLSLNEYENRLILCGSQSYIQVMQLKSENSWNIVQTIKVAGRGRRLSFLDGDYFVFQPETQDFLELYNYDPIQKQFSLQKQMKIQSCRSCDNSFPIQFIKGLKIAIVKQGLFLNLFKVNNNNDLVLMQTINFGDDSFGGFCSDDGKYIATWDEKSKEIQIRQLRYLE